MARTAAGWRSAQTVPATIDAPNLEHLNRRHQSESTRNLSCWREKHAPWPCCRRSSAGILLVVKQCCPTCLQWYRMRDAANRKIIKDVLASTASLLNRCRVLLQGNRFFERMQQQVYYVFFG
jgi:hypothetical protein